MGDNHQFLFDLCWLRVKGCDIVLGIDWIDSVTLILLNTNPHSVSFIKDGDVVTLFGNKESSQISPTNLKFITKLLKGSFCSFVA